MDVTVFRNYENQLQYKSMSAYKEYTNRRRLFKSDVS